MREPSAGRQFLPCIHSLRPGDREIPSNKKTSNPRAKAELYSLSPPTKHTKHHSCSLKDILYSTLWCYIPSYRHSSGSYFPSILQLRRLSLFGKNPSQAYPVLQVACLLWQFSCDPLDVTGVLFPWCCQSLQLPNSAGLGATTCSADKALRAGLHQRTRSEGKPAALQR